MVIKLQILKQLKDRATSKNIISRTFPDKIALADFFDDFVKDSDRIFSDRRNKVIAYTINVTVQSGQSENKFTDILSFGNSNVTRKVNEIVFRISSFVDGGEEYKEPKFRIS